MQNDWLDYVTAFGTVATPVLVLILTGIGWHIKSRLEAVRESENKKLDRIRELEDKLREDRIEIYNALLEPFFVLFTTDVVFSQDPKYKGKNKKEYSIGKMLTVDYRKVGFKLSLIADDSVVMAYNQLMQFFYHTKENPAEPEIHTSQWLHLLGNLLLEIRKSLGNKETKVDEWEMLEWFITDVQNMRKIYANNTIQCYLLKRASDFQH